MKTPSSLSVALHSLALAAALLLPLLGAHAEERGPGPYVTLDFGPNWAQDTGATFGGAEGTVDFDTGLRFSAGVGYNINRYVGVEFEAGFLYNAVKDTDYELMQVPVLFKGVFRYPNRTPLEPYVEAGVGFVSSTFGYQEYDWYYSNDSYDSDLALAWQAGAGLRFRIGSNFSLGAGYKYFGTASTDYYVFGLPAGFDTLHNHSVLFVARWGF
ncbi:MAG: hypothetical protein RJA22_2845 [Verrucomicrobiota bacterium]|jgi:opacity protein-like surface antigen